MKFPYATAACSRGLAEPVKPGQVLELCGREREICLPGRERRRRACEAIRSSKNGLPRNVEMPSDGGALSSILAAGRAPGGSWHRSWEQESGRHAAPRRLRDRWRPWFVQGERFSPRPERIRPQKSMPRRQCVGYRVGETRAVRRNGRPDATRSPALSADEETDQACYARKD